MKSIFTFSKWTKKMSKINLPKMSLLTDFLYDHIEKLSSQIKPNKFYLLLYFFLKKLKDFSRWKLYGTFRKCFYAKIMPKILL